MDRQPLPNCEVFRVIVWLQDGRHAAVDGFHDFIRIARDDCECAFPLIGSRVLPELPETGHTEGFLSGECEFVFRFLLTLRHLFPLADRIRWNVDAAFEKSIFPKLRCLDTFGSRIEEKTVR